MLGNFFYLSDLKNVQNYVKNNPLSSLAFAEIRCMTSAKVNFDSPKYSKKIPVRPITSGHRSPQCVVTNGHNI